ncbi:Ede1p, partial [Ascoidea rubescens DSM 1968]
LTAEEKIAYSKIFKSLDPETLGIVTGEVARSTFENSSLSPVTLGKIWQIADKDNNGFLTQTDFIVAMRLIAHVQSGKKLSPSLANIAGPVARFNGAKKNSVISPAATGNSFNPITSNNLSSSLSTSLTISNEEILQYSQLFDNLVPNHSHLISGMQARSIFLKSNIPNIVLGQIWNIVDRGNKGTLTKEEFILSMFLINSFLTGLIKQVPTSIPNEMWLKINLVLSSNKQQQNLLSQQTIPPTLPSRKPTISASSSLTTVSQNLTGNFPLSYNSTGSTTTISEWAITPQQRVQFDSIFNKLDKEKKNLLSPTQVATFLGSSKLPKEDLAKIWDLSDLKNTGYFSLLEFSVALFLTQRRLRGANLTIDSIPQSLISSI